MKLLQKPILRTLPIFYAQATETRVRRIVFSLLVGWALMDAGLTFRDWGSLPWYLRVYGFFSSLLLSLLFIGLLAVVWDWLARRFARATRN